MPSLSSVVGEKPSYESEPILAVTSALACRSFGSGHRGPGDGTGMSFADLFGATQNYWFGDKYIGIHVCLGFFPLGSD